MAAGLKPVLLVEDITDEADIFAEACKRAGIKNPIVWVGHGAEAVAYLSDLEKERPCVVITDIKMPWMDGFELLHWLKRNGGKWGDIPAIVLTASSAVGDQERAYEFGASAFYTKPGRFEDTVEMLKKINERWMEASREEKGGS